MMRALKPTDVKEGSVISFLYTGKGKYKQVDDETEVTEMDKPTKIAYKHSIVDTKPKIRTLKIEEIQEKEKKDKTREIVGYKVLYGTYDNEFKSSSEQLESLSAREMDCILCHARLMQL
jgi:hypothetical protein